MVNELNNDKKAEILKKEFSEEQISPEDLLSIQDINQFLDKKIRRKFDREISEQLFERAEKSINGRIYTNEFIKVFFEADEMLKYKISHFQTRIEELKRQKIAFQSKNPANKGFESKNVFGVNEDSKLIVKVVEAEIRYTNGPVYVIVQCGEIRQETKLSNGLQLTWNEEFDFPIISGTENVHILIMSSNSQFGDEYLAQATISVNRYEDQNLHDEEIELFDKNGNPNYGVIKVWIQWMHSQSSYVEQNLIKINHDLQSNEEELGIYQKNLNTLYEPFPNLKKASENQFDGFNYHNQDKFLETFAGHGQSEKKTKIHIAITSCIFYNSDYHVEKDKLDKYCNYLVLFSLFLALLVSFDKTTYLSVLTLSLYLVRRVQRNINSSNLKAICSLLLFSILIDIPWLIFYSKVLSFIIQNWWSNSNNLFSNGLLEIHLRRYTIVMTFLFIISKLATLFVAANLQGKYLNDERKEEINHNEF